MLFKSLRLGDVAQIILLFFFLFVLQIILSFVFVQQVSLDEMHRKLDQFSVRISKDLIYKNGKWDTTKYNADPLTPFPNGSSGFTNPLYIITSEGFVIERSQPIKGLLDTSDFKHLLQFQKPQTIDTITNETWRVYSQPIQSNNQTLGTIVVSFYNPNKNDINDIDAKLIDSLNKIRSAIRISNGSLHVTQVDVRNIHYEFSFEVVDTFNNVLINNGRVPTFIDVSYVAREMNNVNKRIIRDEKTNEPFMLVSKTITDKSNKKVGVIVCAQSVQLIYNTLRNYIVFSIVVAILLTLPLLLHIIYTFRKELIYKLKGPEAEGTIVAKKIFFDKKDSVIYVDDKPFTIPYSTNQYYICEALFSQPGKRWEQDELLERFGEVADEQSGRKVYDSVLAINKKLGFKLIEYINKTYRIFPPIVSLVEKK